MSFGIDADGFVRASRMMKQVDPELRKAMLKGVRKAATPLREDIRRAVKATNSSASGRVNSSRLAWDMGRSRSPSPIRSARRSGLRASVARSVRIVAKDSGYANQVGVRISSSGGAMPPDQRKLPKHMDRGSWSHPVMGNRKAWVKQTVTPAGWFTKTAKAGAPKAQAHIQAEVWAALHKLAAKLTTAA